MRILLVDDHVIVRAGLIQILKDAYPQVDVGEAGNEAEAIRLVRQGGWDLVLLDINLPGRSGIDVLKQIKSTYPEVPVLMLSMYPEEQYALRALKAGASGYMNKESAPEQLLNALTKVMNGGRYITPAVAEQLADDLQNPRDRKPHELLSDREYQILYYIASGKSVGDIAEILPLSVKTISTYRSRLLKKMGLKHNAELTHYAIKHNLVE